MRCMLSAYTLSINAHASVTSLCSFSACNVTSLCSFCNMVDCCVLQTLDFHFGGMLLTPKREERVLGAVASAQPLQQKKEPSERKKPGTKLKCSMSDRFLAPKPAITKVQPAHRRRAPLLAINIPDCITDDSVIDYNVRKPHSVPQRRCMSLDLDKLMEAHPPPVGRHLH